MEQTHDYRHHFTAANGFEGCCRVRVFEGGDDPEVRSVVLMSDQGDGPSVTNAVEIIAAEVARDRGLDPEATVFLEHYPRAASEIRHGLKEEFDLVRFGHHDPQETQRRTRVYRFGTPAWAPYGREGVQRLIGRKLPDERLSEKQPEPADLHEPERPREFSDGYFARPPYWERIVLERVGSSTGLTAEREIKTTYTNVPHLVAHHSPDGYEWAYQGSGPADLALNICELAVRDLGLGDEDDRIECFEGSCYREAWQLHQGLKRELVARVPREGGEIPWGRVTSYVLETLDLEDRL